MRSQKFSQIGTAPFLLSIIALLDLSLSVTATPPIHSRGPGLLNKQGKELTEGGIESKSNTVAVPPTAELQLEQLKSAPNKTGGVPQKGTLNLETPAVSDNSQPQPESFPGTGSDVLSLSKVESDKKRSPMDSLEKSSTSLKIEMDYTPQDIAEYIFWTGDEPGVVSALNDFLQDELVDKDDVIRFLEDVKVELKLLKTRYATVTNPPENLKFKGPSRLMSSSQTSSPFEGRNREKRIVEPGEERQHMVTVEGDQELVAKMNQMNIKLREDSLEEIIYRLAKELFLGGSGEHSIQKFAHFIEEAGASGHIPKDLEKNVLDILVAALVDSVSEKEHRNRQKVDNWKDSSYLRPIQTPSIMKH